MPALFRNHTAVSCFFCQYSISPSPRNPRAFRCPHCSCWNRYDANGDIVSDEPAMHDENLNTKSFAKRASPSKDRLPTMYGAAPFCHTCQTNQMLLVNLLSNYLPPPEDPEYTRRLELLPEYRNSLHIRYPPVCANCQSAVDDEIRKKEHMARTKALGAWLKESKGKDKMYQVSGPGALKKHNIGLALIIWRIRGCFWILTQVVALLGNAAVVLRYPVTRNLHQLVPMLPALTLMSVFWTFWDPTYSSIINAQRQGRHIRLQGKNRYITLQMASWLSRLLTSSLLFLRYYKPSLDYLHLSQTEPSARGLIYFSASLILEILVFLISCFVLRLQKPPAIRLIDTTIQLQQPSRPPSIPLPNHGSRLSTPFESADPSFLSTLSLSNQPIIPANPIFGRPSLISSAPAPRSAVTMDEDVDTDAMDWSPTDPSSPNQKDKLKAIHEGDDGYWLRPQRFFPPEKPTGLEGLFARTRLVDGSDGSDPRTNMNGTVGTARSLNWWWVYIGSLVPLLGVIAYNVFSNGVVVV